MEEDNLLFIRLLDSGIMSLSDGMEFCNVQYYFYYFQIDFALEWTAGIFLSR